MYICALLGIDYSEQCTYIHQQGPNNTVCPTRYRNRHFLNNSKFEQEYVRCVRNEEECVCSVSVVRLIVATRSSGPPASQPVIKEMPGSVASGTLYTCICSHTTELTTPMYFN